MFMRSMLLVALVIGIIWELKHLFLGYSAANYLKRNTDKMKAVAEKIKILAKINAEKAKLPPTTDDLPGLVHGALVDAALRANYGDCKLSRDEGLMYRNLFLLAIWSAVHCLFDIVLIAWLAAATGYPYVWVMVVVVILMSVITSIKAKDASEPDKLAENTKKFAAGPSTCTVILNKAWTLATIAVYVAVILQYYMGVGVAQ